jgi:hypothetical protein
VGGERLTPSVLASTAGLLSVARIQSGDASSVGLLIELVAQPYLVKLRRVT